MATRNITDQHDDRVRLSVRYCIDNVACHSKVEKELDRREKDARKRR
jgi:hypothetical protein